MTAPLEQLSQAEALLGEVAGANLGALADDELVVVEGGRTGRPAR